MQAYIYHLKNIITDKEYIGCAINFETRLEKHLSHLRLGKHHSWKLQQAYKDYGWESFTTSFIILSLTIGDGGIVASFQSSLRI